MRVKRFIGESVNEAVAQLKQEFGKEAVILHTKKVRIGGLFGLFGKQRYEVIGAVDPQALAELEEEKSRPISVPMRKNPYAKEKKTEEPEPVKPSRFSSPKDPPSKSPVTRPAPSVSLEGKTSPPANPKVWPEEVQRIYDRLILAEIPKKLAQELLREMLRKVPTPEWQDPNGIWRSLRPLITDRIGTVDPWELSSGQKVVVLIGPTGVGKTTTIAKLAANFALVAGKNVGLVTVDTYRVAAVEQLRAYADILGVPLEVAYSPTELKQALKKMSDKDLVLIDTAGRSHKNRLQMAELKNFLQGISGAEIHLVVSATTKGQDITDIIQRYRDINIDRLVFTKLDETTGYGVMLRAVDEADAPIAFITSGQSVPEDIEVAQAEKIAELILGE